MEITCEHVSKYFSERAVFRDINFIISSGQSMAITGPNGSGKTTLVRLICHLLQPSEGKLVYSVDGEALSRENCYAYIGLVGPYLELYEELTAGENLQFFARMKNVPDRDERIRALMERFGLRGREDDLVKTYSSGMKQRLKYVFALLHEPKVLLVDEPRSNLDEEGVQTVYQVMEQQKRDHILIIATNDRDDLRFADWTLPIHA